MKTVIIVLNLVLIVYLAIVALSNFDTGNDFFSYVLIVVIVVLLLNVFFNSPKHDKGWLRLYFKRKALEEKNKIDKLTKE